MKKKTDETPTQGYDLPPAQPRKYVGPIPAPHISNLPCGCTLPADQLSRAQQDYVIETVPEAATWYE